MSDSVPGQIRFTEPSSYTETLCTVSATNIVGAAPVEVVNVSGFVRVDYVTVHYAWRTQLGHDVWKIGNIDVVGPLVTADGVADESRPGYKRIALILGLRNAPDWIRRFAQAHRPESTLVIGRPGDSPASTVAHAQRHEPAEVGAVTIGEVSSETEIRHSLDGIGVTGAAQVTLPGFHPGEPDRYITPDTLRVNYRWRGDHAGAGWRAIQIDTIGPYVAADGSARPGRAAARFAPAWATDYALAHLPTHIRLVDSDTVADPPDHGRAP